MKGELKEIWNWVARLFDKKVPVRWYHNNGNIWCEYFKSNTTDQRTYKFWHKRKNSMYYFYFRDYREGLFQGWNDDKTRGVIDRNNKREEHGAKIEFKYES